MRIKCSSTGEYVSLRQVHLKFRRTGAVPNPELGIRGSWADPQNPTKEELESVGFTYELPEEVKAKREATLTEAVSDFSASKPKKKTPLQRLKFWGK